MKETRRLVPVAVPLEVGDALDSYHLGDLRVGMHASKAVLAAQQRLQHGLMREAVGKFKIRGIGSHCRCIRKHLGKAAVLAAQHVLELFVGKAGSKVGHPVHEPEEQFTGIFIACHEVSIPESGVGLVYGV